MGRKIKKLMGKVTSIEKIFGDFMGKGFGRSDKQQDLPLSNGQRKSPPSWMKGSDTKKDSTPVYQAPSPPAKKEKSKAELLFEKQEYGAALGAIPEVLEKNSTNVFFGDGVWLVRQNEIGRFVRQMSTAKIPGLAYGPEASFEFKLPRIPKEILKTQVNFYREVMKVHANSEAYTMILWDTVEKKYILVCPGQKISQGFLSYDFGAEAPGDRYLHVVSCHSHNSMGAFFSGIDDKDEKGDMLYMVMGKLNTPTPEYKLRASSAGAQVKLLNVADVFEEGFDDKVFAEEAPSWSTAEFPQDWLTKLVSGSVAWRHGGDPSGPRFHSGSTAGDYSYKYSFSEKGNQSKGSAWSSTHDDNDDIYEGWTSRYVANVGYSGEAAASYPKDNYAIRAAAYSLIEDLRRKPGVEDALFNFMDKLDALGYREEMRDNIETLDAIDTNDEEASDEKVDIELLVDEIDGGKRVEEEEEDDSRDVSGFKLAEKVQRVLRESYQEGT